MRVYFAITSSEYLEVALKKGARNILISFIHRKLIDKIRHNKEINLMIDSGAYSAWTKNKKIDLDDYIKFCKDIKKNNSLNELYLVNLDVIPGRFGYIPSKEEIERAAKQGWKNYEIMKKEGLNVIHIFHQHEKFKWLDKLLKERVDYIGISPANDLSRKKRLNWLKRVFTVVKDKKKTHGFGVMDVEILKKIPFYSCDGSNWTGLVRWGVMSVYKDLSTKSLHYKKIKDALEMKLNPRALKNPKELVFELEKVVDNILKMESEITKLWTKRGVKME